MNIVIKIIAGIGTGVFILCLLAVGFCFMIGMFLLRMAIILGALNEVFHFGHPDPSSIFVNVSYSWEKFAILVVFFESWKRRYDFSELRKASEYTKMFVGSVFRYFEFEPETKALRESRLCKKSFVHKFWENSFAEINDIIKGGKDALDDDALSAIPIRTDNLESQKYLTFEKDIKSILTNS